MSATTELLAEKLRELENMMSEAKTSGDEARLTKLTSERDELVSKLTQANEGLNEGTRRLLKG